MPLDPASAALSAIKFLFAVGDKVSEVLVDEAVMSDLILPRPRLPHGAMVSRATVVRFFETEEGKALREELAEVEAAWTGWDRVDDLDDDYGKVLLPTYLASAAAMRVASSALTPIDGHDLAGYVVVKAYLAGQRPCKGAFPRILGEVVNQGLDFLNENAGVLPVKANLRKILEPVIQGLSDIDLAESPFNQALLRRMLGVALDGLGAAAQISIPGEGLKLLVGNLTTAVSEIVDSDDPVELDDFLDLKGPLLRALLKTAATTMVQRPSLTADWARGLLLPLATEIAKTGEFSEETLCHLAAVSIRSAGRELLKDGALSGILGGLAETLADHVEDGIDVDLLFREVGPRAVELTASHLDVFLPNLAVQVTQLTLDALGSAWKKGQSTLDVAAWVNEMLAAAATNLDLRASVGTKKSALYQLVGSVVAAASADSAGLLSAQGRTRLLSIALAAFEDHAPVLLNLKNPDFKTNVLWSALQGTLAAASRAATPVSERMLLKLCEAAVQGASKAAIAKVPMDVRAVVEKLLRLWDAGELDLTAAIEELMA